MIRIVHIEKLWNLLGMKTFDTEDFYIDNQVICPQCGSYMEVRSGYKGLFYGCTNYPHCQYILKLNNRKFFDKDEITRDLTFYIKY